VKNKKLVYLTIVIFSSLIILGFTCFSTIQNRQINLVTKSEVDALTIEDFSVKGVIPGQLLSDSLVKELGKPNSIQIKTSSVDTKTKCYIYSGLKIETLIVEESNAEIVTTIDITGNNIKTKRGITLFDNAEKVREKYGLPDAQENYYFYSTLLDTGDIQPAQETIRFKIEDDKVTEIKIFG
jgi:hypothetical protein